MTCKPVLRLSEGLEGRIRGFGLPCPPVRAKSSTSSRLQTKLSSKVAQIIIYDLRRNFGSIVSGLSNAREGN